MPQQDERQHTTLNLSRRLLREASTLFKGRSRTDLIHDALERMVRTERLARHIKQWAGKGRIKSYA